MIKNSLFKVIAIFGMVYGIIRIYHSEYLITSVLIHLLSVVLYVIANEENKKC